MNSSKSLVHVDLSYNNLNSSIFQWLSSTHTNLVYLDLSGNNFTGVVGWLEAINMLPKLSNLILSGCNLPPPIMSSVSVMNSSKSLVRVDLYDNNLDSSIFQWLSGTHTNLVELDLSWNNLNGSSIPDDFGNMSSLASLYLSGSRLKGGIPNSFAKLCRLRVLYLGNNSLSGQLSDIIDILSKCAQNTLEYLDISDNHGIMGSVPENIGQMSKLEAIDFGGNSLEGVISEIHFSKLFRLYYLDLSSSSLVLNFRFDWVPPFQLDTITLRSCKMGPSFPKWLQTQKSVSSLDIYDNGITDTIPSWLWDFSHGLYFMDLSQNQIRGTIGNLRSEFPPKLNELESLDLSKNQINGKIPTSLSWIASLGKLNLSENNLFGKIPIGTQLQSFDYAYDGNRLLCGAPLPRTCPEEEKGPRQSVLVNQDSQGVLITQGHYISMGLGFAVGFWGVCGTLLLNKSCRYTYFNFLTFLNDWLHVKAAIICQRMLNR
ncbi:probable leucine-rich repeat receptor-like protein kinase At5g63930 [Prunus avium]|uniref:Probable leucine-rich repeat receptor-like protein kinase At5g63930 n=1 Tax=Prunus avium TaxID=42229 RepID=A0A6P5RFF5_PRUAV|nr:probable leucine-rich repeat receptor-like protein kinase At5g63930 [Prunus avium]